MKSEGSGERGAGEKVRFKRSLNSLSQVCSSAAAWGKWEGRMGGGATAGPSNNISVLLSNRDVSPGV